MAERFTAPSVRKTIAVDLELLDFHDRWLTTLALYIVNTAKHQDPHNFYLLRTIPGVGKILAVVLLYEIHDICRFPRVQEFASSARLVKCPKESAGKKQSPGHNKIGNVHLKWAFSEAACFFLRHNAPGQQYHQRLVSKHGKGKALAILAHKLGRAIYFMLKRKEAFARKKFFSQGSLCGAGDVSLSPH